MAETKLGFAEYVSMENAPVIDGDIDDVWETMDSYILTGISLTDGGDCTYGKITILWNETGLILGKKGLSGRLIIK